MWLYFYGWFNNGIMPTKSSYDRLLMVDVGFLRNQIWIKKYTISPIQPKIYKVSFVFNYILSNVLIFSGWNF